jgi:hypothetical protein
MIYKEVLFVRKVHYAPEEQLNAGRHCYERGYEKPQLSLLRVCKQVHAEAEPLYLSMNLFELPDNFTECEPFCGLSDGRNRSWVFSEAAFHHVRNLSIPFTTNQLRVTYYRTHWCTYEDHHGDGSYMRLTDAERREQVHTLQNGNDWYDWGQVQLNLHKFETTMEYVEVDFSDAYSTCGCCRLLPACIDRWILRLKPKVLIVSGLLAGEETDFQFETARNSTLRQYTLDVLKAKYGLHFLQPREITQ